MLLGLDKKSLKMEVCPAEILTNEQMLEADRLTIESGIEGYELMTAAGQGVANIVSQHYPHHTVLILCGPGNNGGDGLVAAMFLEGSGHDVHIMGLVAARKLKGDAKQALKDWGGKMLSFDSLPEDLPKDTVVIDAVFGTGLSKPLGQPVIDVFKAVQEKGWPVVAVDVPSGVNGNGGAVDEHSLQAAYTVTFFRKKKAHVLMPSMEWCGDITVQDIGIEGDVLEQTGFALLDNVRLLWSDKVPKPRSQSHKYTRGHLVVLGGVRMTGAARMASEAGMRIGAGVCTVTAPEQAADVYMRAAAHVMYEPLAEKGFAVHLLDDRRTAALMGPGAGLENKDLFQEHVVAALKTGKPIVLDADAISCFEGNAEALHSALHEKCVLTPHEGEFERIFPSIDGDRLNRAEQAATLSGAVILLKGPDTIIAQTGKRTVVNTHATPWLATAGAGDVLAGMIAGLMAQKIGAFDAACMGAWMHGEAAERKGPGLVAPDIIELIPSVLRDFA